MTVTLTHPGVNGGAPVTLFNSRVSYNWKNLIRVPPNPQRYDITEVSGSGWENPVIVLNGSFNVDSLDSSEVRQSLLMKLAKESSQYKGTVGTTLTLSITVGTSSSQTNLLANDESTTSLKVVVDAFSLSFDAVESDKGHIWNYSITLRETK